jgi:hypothetical protein
MLFLFSAASSLTRRHNDGPNSKLGSPTGAASVAYFFSGFITNQPAANTTSTTST